MGTQAREIIRALPEARVHAREAACRSWATVDLSVLAANVRLVRSLVGPRCGVGAVVKANAYGHGAVPVARAAVGAGASALVVANAHEGVELRQAGIRCPIIVIGASFAQDAEAVVAHDLGAVVSPPEFLEALAAAAARYQRPARAHLMLDLGMRRAGLGWDDAVEVARRLAETPWVDLEGVASHFPTADEIGSRYSEEVVARFAGFCAVVRGFGLKPRYVHLANSAGLLRFRAAHFNLVRAGIMLYGMAPSVELAGAAPWRPVLEWRTRVVCLREVAAGTPVGYGHTWRAERASRLATLPVGYYDGYLRAYSNNAEVLIQGQRAPVVGRVSMDYTVVDVTDVPGVEVGDVATLLGRDGGEAITAEELARRRGTIPYEVTCAIGPRVRRVYVETEGVA